MNKKVFLSLAFLTLCYAACGGSSGSDDSDSGGTGTTGDTSIASGLIRPSDLVYQGAFRLPEGSNATDWTWSGAAMAYYPGGDPGGPADGYPGSIFGTGHNWVQYVSEISIPLPVNSAAKNPGELNTATTLQGFHDIKASLNVGELELPRMGLEYLPAQGSQSTGKLYFCWGQHMQFDQTVSHGWCELDLANPRTAGGWFLGNRDVYTTNDYLFEIPEGWANTYTPGRRLASGRYRDGGQGGQGPTLFAYGPWNEGNPPAPGTRLGETVLLLYSSSRFEDPTDFKINNYHHSDEWAGGAWLTAGDNAAVIFVGTKGVGNCWYGFANGVVWPDEGPFPPVPDAPNDQRGWWSDSFQGQIIFYNPADLAAVASGAMAPYEPQPYATMEIDQYLYQVTSSQDLEHVGAASFDRQQGHLYVFEPLADGERSIVHVWSVTG